MLFVRRAEEKAKMNPFTVKDLEALARQICSALVDNPKDLDVYTTPSSQHLLIEVVPAKADSGQLLGRGGQNTNAIRQILQSVATKNGIQLHFTVDPRP